MSTPSTERYEELAVKAVDGLLTTEEDQELQALLAENPEHGAELEDFISHKGVTDAMRERILSDATFNPPRESKSSFRWLIVFWLLLLVGFGATYGFGFYSLLTDPEAPLIIQLGLGCLAAGGLGLLGYTINARLRGHKHDPYKEIDR